jgi:hypothetical protein
LSCDRGDALAQLARSHEEDTMRDGVKIGGTGAQA